MPEEVNPTAAQGLPKGPVISNDPRTTVLPGNSEAVVGTSADMSSLPTERVTLPSRGLLYPKTNPASAGFVLVRPITTSEEEILVTERFAKQGVIIDMLLSRCIVTRGINTLDLLSGDRSLILFYLRAISYGPEYTFMARLKDGSQQEVVTNVSKLKIKELPDGFAEPFIAQVNGITYELRLSRGSDEQAMTRERLAQKRKDPKAADGSLTSALIRQVVSVNGETDEEKIATHVRRLIAKDSQALRSAIAKASPGPQLIQSVVNNETGETEEVAIQMTESFFRANDEPAGAVGDS